MKRSKSFPIIDKLQKFLKAHKLSPAAEKDLRRLVKGTFTQGKNAGFSGGYRVGHECGFDLGMEECGFEQNPETGESEAV
jgi:hypothetical protein